MQGPLCERISGPGGLRSRTGGSAVQISHHTQKQTKNNKTPGRGVSRARDLRPWCPISSRAPARPPGARGLQEPSRAPARFSKPSFTTLRKEGPLRRPPGGPPALQQLQALSSNRKVARPPHNFFSLSEISMYTNEKVLLLTKMDLTEFRS